MPVLVPTTSSYYAARHRVEPVTEVNAMQDINEAFEKLRNGSPRYRLVLTR